MPKVYGIHMVELHPRVKAEDFEKFVKEEMPQSLFEGWKAYLLKGDRGDRKDKYLLMYEIESVEARNRVISSTGELSEEAKQFFESHGAMFEKWATFATPLTIIIFTDYVVLF